jgi:hypothetical protein
VGFFNLHYMFLRIKFNDYDNIYLNMKYIITESQRKKLKLYKLIKFIVDSFTFDNVVKTTFELNFNDKFGFYEIDPTFYVTGFILNEKSFLFDAKMALVKKLELYTGVHIVPVGGKLERE